jgi:hypothetical protein
MTALNALPAPFDCPFSATPPSLEPRAAPAVLAAPMRTTNDDSGLDAADRMIATILTQNSK